jgi:hypothetical protein
MFNKSKEIVHYIWMGSLDKPQHIEAFQNGPNLLATKQKPASRTLLQRLTLRKAKNKIKIIMWVPEALIEKIQSNQLLDPAIKIRSVESFLATAKLLAPKDIHNLQITLNLLGEYQAYSAQKDVLSMAILEEYGGYYFDTTTKINSPEQLLNKDYTTIKFVSFNNLGVFFQESGVMQPDVWALYCPQQVNGVFRAMLHKYFEKCAFCFPANYAITPPACLGEGAGRMVTEPGVGPKLMVSNAHEFNRNFLISYLVTYSLLEGLYDVVGDLSDEKMMELSWVIKWNRQDNYMFLEELNIYKYHRGLWRNMPELKQASDNTSSMRKKINSMRQGSAGSEHDIDSRRTDTSTDDSSGDEDSHSP